MSTRGEHLVEIPAGAVHLAADVSIPDRAQGVVVFAHGSGSSRRSPRNRSVALSLQQRRFATVLTDLLTPDEAEVDNIDGHLRFDIDFLGRRVVWLIDWARLAPGLQALRLGLFGASTGAAAALVAAADRPRDVAAVVSRGGRPDLAGASLPRVVAPTLLIVGGLDIEVLELNTWAQARMRTRPDVAVVPGSGHLFEEPGALERVARLAGDWFERYVPVGHPGAGVAVG
jgi:pimeloyl-ACP methyl ester carboxylesterase